ncbi:MAG: hypothetical protein EBX52_00625 [Proteobacteria bacterium]|nr:hypothetical protein [Pseudomonadota bacterium]
MFLALFSAVDPVASSADAKSVCELQDPVSGLLPPVPCPGTSIFLKDSDFCGSCAIKTQAMAVKDAVSYPTQNLDILVGNALKEESFQSYYRGPEYQKLKDSLKKASARLQESQKVVDDLKVKSADSRDWVPREVSDRARVDWNKALNDYQAIKAESTKAVDSWFAQYQKNTAAKFQDSDLKAKVDRLAREKYCADGVKVTWGQVEGIETVGYEGADLPDSKVYSGLADQLKDDYGDQPKVCSEPVPMRSKLIPVAPVEVMSVPASDFFADNKTTLDPAKSANILRELDRRLRPTGKPNCFLRIKSVQILTSANQKANTGEWELNGQRWDFAALSAQRAATLQKLIGGHLVAGAKKGRYQLAGDPLAKNGITGIDSEGEHGDGTSGKCPYRLESLPDSKGEESGMFRVVPDQKVWVSPEMNSAKNAQIEVETEETGPGCNTIEGAKESDVMSYVASKCFVPKFECK